MLESEFTYSIRVSANSDAVMKSWKTPRSGGEATPKDGYGGMSAHAQRNVANTRTR